MSFRLIFQIAKAHLLTRKKQSIIAAMGVMFGIGTYIIMMSFMNGLNGLLDNLILNRTPHIHLYNEIKPNEKQALLIDPAYKGKQIMIHSVKPKNVQLNIHNALPLMEHLARLPEVKGVTPQVKAQSFYLGGATQLTGLLMGVDILKEQALYDIDQYIVQGSVVDLSRTANGILLGAGVAKKLALKVGDFIQIITKTGDILNLKIVGLYQSGMAEIDNVQSYVNLQLAQRISNVGKDFISDINVKLFDMQKAPALAKRMAAQYHITATDIQTANAQFETGSSIRTMISYAVSITLLIVAGFGIYNILNMLIFEKMNDIAILKAVGFSGKDVKYIFISQAMLIGFVGGLIGLLLGFSVSVIIDNTPFETAALPTIKTFPIVYRPVYYIIGVSFSLIATFFAGYFPSRKAEKMDPVDIIRGQ